MKRSTWAASGLVIIFTALGLTYNACSTKNFEITDAQSALDLGSQSGSDPTITRYMITNGIIKLTPAGVAAALPFTGRIMMVRDTLRGVTDVYVHAAGLGASLAYPVHVHDQACAVGGGGHYLINKDQTATSEMNEVWPALQTAADGSGSGFKSVNHIVRPEGQSIVIHDPTTPATRLACGSFVPQLSTSSKSGRFVLLSAGVTANSMINGNAVIIRNPTSNQTVVKVKVAGLSANTNYPAHVHGQACANMDGGAHYKMNSAVTEVTPSVANELWVPLAANATGFAESRIEVDHVAGAEALSIVIHDPVTPANRLACVDLITDGGFVSTDVGLQRGRNILGSGKLERKANGTTVASVALSGLLPNTAYTGHVHDRPCHISGGGGHYKLDYSNALAVESNEIWIRVTTDASGSGSGSTMSQAIARPEAQSIVIHDPTDGGRIACMDLY